LIGIPICSENIFTGIKRTTVEVIKGSLKNNFTVSIYKNPKITGHFAFRMSQQRVSGETLVYEKSLQTDFSTCVSCETLVYEKSLRTDFSTCVSWETLVYEKSLRTDFSTCVSWETLD